LGQPPPPVPTAPDESLCTAQRPYGCRPAHPPRPRFRPDMPGQGYQRWADIGANPSANHRPVAVILRERGQRPEHRPPRVPLAPPHGDGVGHGGAEATRDAPFPPLKRTCFRPTHRGTPRRVICLATGQHRQQTGRRHEARAPTNRWRLNACLTPTTTGRRRPITGRKHRRQTAGALGVYPHYRAGQWPLPRGSTRVEAPRYPVGGATVPVAGSPSARRTRASHHTIGLKTHLHCRRFVIRLRPRTPRPCGGDVPTPRP
jgi:hypothetical protein